MTDPDRIPAHLRCIIIGDCVVNVWTFTSPDPCFVFVSLLGRGAFSLLPFPVLVSSRPVSLFTSLSLSLGLPRFSWDFRSRNVSALCVGFGSAEMKLFGKMITPSSQRKLRSCDNCCRCRFFYVHLSTARDMRVVFRDIHSFTPSRSLFSSPPRY